MYTVSQLINTVAHYIPGSEFIKQTPSKVSSSVVHESMSSIIRIGGLSGAIAVSMGAYGAHVIRDNPKVGERRRLAFETAHRYHLIHSLALVAAPRARYPTLVASLFSLGLILFCGSSYHYGLTGNETVRKVTPIGGVTLILAWLSFVL